MAARLMTYLLDSDTLILLMRGLRIRAPKSASQKQRVRQADSILANCQRHGQSGHRIAVSAITVAELEFGARHSGRYEIEIATVHEFLAPFELEPFTPTDCAAAYGLVRHELGAKGLLIGENDLLIAAHGLALGATVVTNNTREFGRVPDLTVENWCLLKG
jgi:tRNA(fMet)-specific endonuclease VapC